MAISIQCAPWTMYNSSGSRLWRSRGSIAPVRYPCLGPRRMEVVDRHALREELRATALEEARLL